MPKRARLGDNPIRPTTSSRVHTEDKVKSVSDTESFGLYLAEDLQFP